MKFKQILILIVVILIVAASVMSCTKKNEMENIKRISYSELVQKTDNNEEFILLFASKDCSHCQNYKPKFNEVLGENKTFSYFIEVSELTEQELNDAAKKFDFNAWPMTMYVKDGTFKNKRIEGDAPKYQIQEFIDTYTK